MYIKLDFQKKSGFPKSGYNYGNPGEKTMHIRSLGSNRQTPMDVSLATPLVAADRNKITSASISTFHTWYHSDTLSIYLTAVSSFTH